MIRKIVRTTTGFLTGIVAAVAFLYLSFRVWQSLTAGLRPTESALVRLVLFVTEMSFFCIAGLIFGVAAAIIARQNMVVMTVGAAIVAFVCMLPFMLIEGHFVFAMVPFTIPVAVGAAILAGLGQGIVNRLLHRTDALKT